MTNRREFLAACAGLAGAGLLPETAVAAGGQIGVVLLHGKTSGPGALGGVAGALSSAGFITVSPNLPWSSSRYLSGDVRQALGEIAGAVAQARGLGAQRVVLLGQSMGCAGAMAYAARAGRLAGLVLTSPGHNPAGYYANTPQIRESVDRARSMVKSRRGGERAMFFDNNQGRIFTVETSAANYLSYFDPNGVFDMRRSVRGSVPTMWVVGSADRVAQWGASIGKRATARKGSAYVVIPGGSHRSTPGQAASQIVAWLKAL